MVVPCLAEHINGFECDAPDQTKCPEYARGRLAENPAPLLSRAGDDAPPQCGPLLRREVPDFTRLQIETVVGQCRLLGITTVYRSGEII